MVTVQVTDEDVPDTREVDPRHAQPLLRAFATIDQVVCTMHIEQLRRWIATACWQRRPRAQGDQFELAVPHGTKKAPMGPSSDR